MFEIKDIGGTIPTGNPNFQPRNIMGPMEVAKGFDKIRVKWLTNAAAALVRDKIRIKWIANAAAALAREKDIEESDPY